MRASFVAPYPEEVMDRMHIQIDGMTCGHCVASVKKALGALSGVALESVSVGSADVRYDPATIDEGAVLEALRDAGYPARVQSRTATV